MMSRRYPPDWFRRECWDTAAWLVPLSGGSVAAVGPIKIGDSSERALYNGVSLWRVSKKSVSAQLGQVHARVASTYLHPLSHFAGIYRSAHPSKKLYSAGLHRALFQPAGLSLGCERNFQPVSFPGELKSMFS